MEQFYVMPSFVKLSVHHITESAEWYAKALGFETVFSMPGPDGKTMLTHLRRAKYQDILLVATPSEFFSTQEHPGYGVTINFASDNVDEIFEKSKKLGASIIEGPLNRPWNAREITIQDLDGYQLTFTQQMDPSKTFTDVITNVQNNR
ncbi:VOC family protein [Aneurinibacillus tyrosinisolvens]|jgi:uncharacterized glyoxalase superfamily protein PhnB|uniref:VOC family protein n=1 Tax=Aneurinibacillus tyrosinisolvens TaxID=1443435 RepID=UPI00063F055B|nr:VOC family protein [Aneurinibacillus tyrosinisolvens]